MPPLSRRVPLKTGLSYHLLEWGADRPELDHTVILLHGFLDLAWGWEGVAEAGLSDRFHLIAPDMRGHGDSDRVGAGGYYHFADYLADLDALIPEVRRAKVSLIGHSMGGSIASYYAGSYPDRVAKLALLEGLGPPETSFIGPERMATWIETWQRMVGRSAPSYATLEEAAERLRAHDPLLGAELAQRLAEVGTAPARQWPALVQARFAPPHPGALWVRHKHRGAFLVPGALSDLDRRRRRVALSPRAGGRDQTARIFPVRAIRSSRAPDT